MIEVEKEITLEFILSAEEEVRLAIGAILADAESSEEELQMPDDFFVQEFNDRGSSTAKVFYDFAPYEASRNYYELVSGSDDEPAAQMNVSYDVHEHKVFQEAQAIAESARNANITHSSFIEQQLDLRNKDAKEKIKLVSPVIWMLMYNGKLTFN